MKTSSKARYAVVIEGQSGSRMRRDTGLTKEEAEALAATLQDALKPNKVFAEEMEAVDA